MPSQNHRVVFASALADLASSPEASKTLVYDQLDGFTAVESPNRSPTSPELARWRGLPAIRGESISPPSPKRDEALERQHAELWRSASGAKLHKGPLANLPYR